VVTAVQLLSVDVSLAKLVVLVELDAVLLVAEVAVELLTIDVVLLASVVVGAVVVVALTVVVVGVEMDDSVVLETAMEVVLVLNIGVEENVEEVII